MTDLHDRIDARLDYLMSVVHAWPGCTTFPRPEVYYYNRGTAAGKAHFGTSPGRIGIHETFLQENPDDMVHDTVAHEVAHLVVFWKWQCEPLSQSHPRAHGREWQQVMRRFGIEPKRTHRYDMSNVARRRVRYWVYSCRCRSHKVSTVTHNRIQKNPGAYRCGSCLQLINFEGRAL